MLPALLLAVLTQSAPPLVDASTEQWPERSPFESLDSARDERGSRFRRVGFAGILGLGINPVKETASFHGRVGMRLGLLKRSTTGSGVNLAVAVLGGGGTGGGSGTTLGLDLRVELLYVGNKVEALEPIGNVYFTTGIVFPTDGRSRMGYHVGGGLGFDLIFSGVLGNTTNLWSDISASRELGLFIAAAILIVTSPTLECRYTMRSDGTGFTSVVIGVGI